MVFSITDVSVSTLVCPLRVPPFTRRWSYRLQPDAYMCCTTSRGIFSLIVLSDRERVTTRASALHPTHGTQYSPLTYGKIRDPKPIRTRWRLAGYGIIPGWLDLVKPSQFCRNNFAWCFISTEIHGRNRLRTISAAAVAAVKSRDTKRTEVWNMTLIDRIRFSQRSVARSAVGWVFVCSGNLENYLFVFLRPFCCTHPALYRPDGGGNYKRVSLNMNYFTGNDKLMRFRDFKIIILVCGLV